MPGRSSSFNNAKSTPYLNGFFQLGALAHEFAFGDGNSFDASKFQVIMLRSLNLISSSA